MIFLHYILLYPTIFLRINWWTYWKEFPKWKALACNDRHAFFTSDAVKNFNFKSCQKVCEAFSFLLDNIYIRFGSKLQRQIVDIPMGTYSAALVANLVGNLFLYCYERNFVLSLSDDNQFEVIETFILLLGIWMTY